MRTKTLTLLASLTLFSLSGGLSAQDILDTVQQGCGPEIETYCSQVSLGEGRLLACFYAHEDKLSGQCQYALYSAANQLDQAISALHYVATECQGDIVEHCAEVQMGDGRIAECLEENAASLSPSCTKAIDDVFE
jgi:hypothetical protein